MWTLSRRPPLLFMVPIVASQPESPDIISKSASMRTVTSWPLNPADILILMRLPVTCSLSTYTFKYCGIVVTTLVYQNTGPGSLSRCSVTKS